MEWVEAGFFEAWLRHELGHAAGYFDMWQASHSGGMGSVLASSDSWFVGCGPFYKVGGRMKWPYDVQFIPRFFSIRLKCDWAKWEEYIGGQWTEGLIPDVVRVLQPTVNRARAALPDVASLEARIGGAPE